MPKVDFYLIPESSKQEQFRFASRLLEKAYHQNHQVYVHVANAADAHQLNDQLWTFRDISFVPHGLVGEKLESTPPIQIGYDNNSGIHQDILLNLSQGIPNDYATFNRVIEVVFNDPQTRQAARGRYKQYQSEGCEIETHDLRK